MNKGKELNNHNKPINISKYLLLLLSYSIVAQNGSTDFRLKGKAVINPGGVEVIIGEKYNRIHTLKYNDIYLTHNDVPKLEVKKIARNIYTATYKRLPNKTILINRIFINNNKLSFISNLTDKDSPLIKADINGEIQLHNKKEYNKNHIDLIYKYVLHVIHDYLTKATEDHPNSCINQAMETCSKKVTNKAIDVSLFLMGCSYACD